MAHLRRANSNCESPNPANTVTDRLNNLLKNSGAGYVLQLCPQSTYFIQAPLLFAHPNQEISTVGYPTGNSRAILSVSGPIVNGTGHTTAIDGTCSTCSGIRLRNIQVCRTFGSTFTILIPSIDRWRPSRRASYFRTRSKYRDGRK